MQHLIPKTLTISLCLLLIGCGSSSISEDESKELRTTHFDGAPPREVIRIDELPEPFHTQSAKQTPQVVGPPDDATLTVPTGFEVNVFASGIKKARWLAITPGGDVLCSAGREDKVWLLRDRDDDGVADDRHLLLNKAGGANQPFGMAFRKVDGEDSDPTWHFYLGNTDAVLRWLWSRDKNELVGKPTKITDLPGQGYRQHWTRNIAFSPDGNRLYVSVGSESNVDIENPPRASVLVMEPDGSGRKVYASGLRNPVGMDFHPSSGKLWVSVNERDGMGDDLVPDYLAEVNEGEFYGWPYAYLKPTLLDPRHVAEGKSVAPDMAAKTHTPDVLFQSHSAALGLVFYNDTRFPDRYRGGAFVVFRGSWNRSRGTGYKVVFVPFKHGRPSGGYEDFVTGFLLDPSVPRTWGRPVGTVVAPDGSLLFTEEANGRIYRVAYVGE